MKTCLLHLFGIRSLRIKTSLLTYHIFVSILEAIGCEPILNEHFLTIQNQRDPVQRKTERLEN